jgi:hypothetical protein
MDADLAVAAVLEQRDARLVGREDQRDQLVEATLLGRGVKGLDHGPCQASPTRPGIDVHSQLADPAVDAAVVVRPGPSPGHHVAVLLGHHVGAPLLDPVGEVLGSGRDGAEGGGSVADPPREDRRDGLGVLGARWADVHAVRHRAGR